MRGELPLFPHSMFSRIACVGGWPTSACPQFVFVEHVLPSYDVSHSRYRVNSQGNENISNDWEGF